MLRRRTLVTALAWGIFSAGALAAPVTLLVAPAGPSPLEPGSTAVVTWSAGDFEAYEEMELVLSVDGGLRFPIRVTRRIAPAERGSSFIVPSLPTAHARLALRAGADEAPDDETIVAVGEEFAIGAPASATPEELFEVGGEERTRDALEGAPPPAAPDSSLASAGDRVTRPGPLDLPARSDSFCGQPVRVRTAAPGPAWISAPAARAPVVPRFTARLSLRL